MLIPLVRKDVSSKAVGEGTTRDEYCKGPWLPTATKRNSKIQCRNHVTILGDASMTTSTLVVGCSQ